MAAHSLRARQAEESVQCGKDDEQAKVRAPLPDHDVGGAADPEPGAAKRNGSAPANGAQAPRAVDSARPARAARNGRGLLSLAVDPVALERANAASRALDERFAADERARPRPRGRALLQGLPWSLTCATGDALALVAAVVIVHRTATEPTDWLWAFPPLALALFAQRFAYRDHIEKHWLDVVGQVARTTAVAAMILMALLALSPGPVRTDALVVTWLLSAGLVTAARTGLVLVQRSARARKLVAARTIIVGSGRVAAGVERRLNEHPELGLRPIGFVDDLSAPLDVKRSAPVLGPLDRLVDIVRECRAQHVVVTFTGARGADAALMEPMRECRRLGARVSVVPRFFEVLAPTGIEHVGTLPVVSVEPVDPQSRRFRIKYVVDQLLAAGLLIVLLPLMCAIAVGVKLSSPGPVLLRQRRVGIAAKEFELLKFRSMRLPDPAPAHAGSNGFVREMLDGHGCDVAPGGVEGEDRRTPLGRFLRRTSLDELPQLLNVVMGDMSLIGPRPERPEFAEIFDRRVSCYSARRRVKPGITGWAQVNGLRGKTSLADRVAWDNFYIEHWSPRLEGKILLLTVAAMFRGAE